MRITEQKPHRSRLSWVVAIALSAVFLYFAFKGTNWQDLRYRLVHADLKFVIASMALVSAALYLRARRWRVLLNIEGTADVQTTYWATALGYLGNYILPARAGEVLRSVAIARRTGLSQSYVFATALSERLFDAAVLILFACAALALVPHLPAWLWSAVRLMGIGASVGVILLLLLPRCGGLLTALIKKTKLSAQLEEKLIGISTQFLLGTSSLVNGRRALRFILYTLIIWATDSASAVITARCVHVNFSFLVGLILIVGIALASAVPSTPGSLGISQFVATSLLALFSVGKDKALAMILLWQGIIYVVMIFWGSIGAWKLKQGRNGIALTVASPAGTPGGLGEFSTP